MGKIFGAALALALASLTGCGGGGEQGTSNAEANVTLTAGQTITMSRGVTVWVPSGTVITEVGGAQVTIAGDNNTITVGDGAVLSAPSTANGAQDNRVVTGASIQTQSAKVTLLAGSATTNLPRVDGTGSAAVLWGGGQIVVDAAGNLIVSDQGALRRVSQAGVVTTLAAGAGHIWQTLAMDASGNLFDSSPNSGWSGSSSTADLVEMSSSGQVTVPFPAWEAGGMNDGSGGMVVDAAGNIYLADAGTNSVVKFTAGGGVSVLAGGGAPGNSDGTGKDASFTFIVSTGLTIDSQGRLYVLSGNHLRMVTPQGVATTIAADLPGVASGGPLALDQAGNFYFGTSGAIRRLDPHGVVSVYATLGTTDFITALATDRSGNLYVGTRGVGAQIFKITQ